MFINIPKNNTSMHTSSLFIKILQKLHSNAIHVFIKILQKLHSNAIHVLQCIVVNHKHIHKKTSQPYFFK